MDRRQFLRTMPFAATGPWLPALAREARNTFLAVRVLTDRPRLASREATRALERAFGSLGVVSADMYPVPGTHTADATISLPDRLVSPAEPGPEADALRMLTRRLDLPRQVSNPVLLTLRIGAPQLPPTQLIARVKASGSQDSTIDLSVDQSGLKVESPHGHVSLEVRGGAVRVRESSCRHRTCESLGWASRPGDELICIPSRIRVSIPGSSDSGIDALAR
ncbi:MAG: hypothetical protein HKN29_03740 [Rhodothermales bacterium]|nr:hypothetical protein [Rhodothermales bacterium]